MCVCGFALPHCAYAVCGSCTPFRSGYQLQLQLQLGLHFQATNLMVIYQAACAPPWSPRSGARRFATLQFGQLTHILVANNSIVFTRKFSLLLGQVSPLCVLSLQSQFCCKFNLMAQTLWRCEAKWGETLMHNRCMCQDSCQRSSSAEIQKYLHFFFVFGQRKMPKSSARKRANRLGKCPGGNVPVTSVPVTSVLAGENVQCFRGGGSMNS